MRNLKEAVALLFIDLVSVMTSGCQDHAGRPQPLVESALSDFLIDEHIRNLGEQEVGQRVSVRFGYHNRSHLPRLLDKFDLSCTCAEVAVVVQDSRYEGVVSGRGGFIVPGGASGIIEVAALVPDVDRTMRIAVRVEISDQSRARRIAKVGADLMPVRVFALVPCPGISGNVVDLGVNSWRARRGFQCRVIARDGRPFIIEGLRPTPNVTVDWKAVAGDNSCWELQGVISHAQQDCSIDRTLGFITDRGGGFQIRVIGSIVRPIEFTPSLVALGVLGEGDVRVCAVEISGAELEEMKIKQVEYLWDARPDGVAFAAKVETSEKLRSAMTISVLAGRQKGRLAGTMRVHFEGSELGPHDLKFIGYVR